MVNFDTNNITNNGINCNKNSSNKQISNEEVDSEISRKRKQTFDRLREEIFTKLRPNDILPSSCRTTLVEKTANTNKINVGTKRNYLQSFGNDTETDCEQKIQNKKRYVDGNIDDCGEIKKYSRNKILELSTSLGTLKNLDINETRKSYNLTISDEDLLPYPGLKILRELSYIDENVFKPIKNVEKSSDLKKQFARQAVFSINSEEKFKDTCDLAEQQFQILRMLIDLTNQAYDINWYTVVDFKMVHQPYEIDIKFNVIVNFGQSIKTSILKTSHFVAGERCSLKFKFLNSKKDKNCDVERVGFIYIIDFEDDDTEVDRLSIGINFTSEVRSMFTTSDELLSLYENATTTEFSLSITENLGYESPDEIKQLLDNSFKSRGGKILANMVLCNPPTLDEDESNVINNNNINIDSKVKLNEEQEGVLKYALTDIPIISVKSPPGTGKTFVAATIVNNNPDKYTFFISESNQACSAFATIVKSLNSPKLKPIRLLSKVVEVKKGKNVHYEEEHVMNEVMNNITEKISPEEEEIINEYKQIKEKWKNISWRLRQDHDTLKKFFTKMVKVTKKYEKIFFKLYKCNLIIMTADYAKKIFKTRSYSTFKPSRIIIDEGSQMCLGKYLEVFVSYPDVQYIIFGDDKQLKPYIPYVNDTKRIESIIVDSIMSLTLKNSFVKNHNLTCSYRMHPEILKLVSKMFYSDTLKCGVSEEQRNLLTNKFPKLQNPILFINIKGTVSEVGSGQSLKNDGEAEGVIKLLEMFKKKNVSPGDVTIISMYKSQAENITERFDCDYAPQVCTVDSFQGSENEIIILCTTKADNSSKGFVSAFLKDENRINVAFSRAKCGLIILGDQNCLSDPVIWNDIIHYLKKKKSFCHLKDVESFFL